MTNDPVVTVTVAGTGGGQIVRWFLRVEDANHPASAPLTASTRGVVATGWLTDLPPGWIDAAVRVHKTLAADPTVDMRHMATHRNSGPLNGPIVPVADQARGR